MNGSSASITASPHGFRQSEMASHPNAEVTAYNTPQDGFPRHMFSATNKTHAPSTQSLKCGWRELPPHTHVNRLKLRPTVKLNRHVNNCIVAHKASFTLSPRCRILCASTSVREGGASGVTHHHQVRSKINYAGQQADHCFFFPSRRVSVRDQKRRFCFEIAVICSSQCLCAGRCSSGQIKGTASYQQACGPKEV